MDSKQLDNTEENKKQEAKSGKGSQNVLLLVLLLAGAAFSYMYFFTDVIKPQNVKKPVVAPVAEAIKKPLPSRDVDAVKAETKNAPVENVKPAEPVKVAPAKVAPVVPVAPAAVVEKQVKVKEEPKKKVSKHSQKSGSDAVKNSSGRWEVVVGNYDQTTSIAKDKAKIKKAGFEAVVKSGVRKKTMMNRLFLAEYEDRSVAKAELAKLKKHTPDAFILDHGGKHIVYAGSYLHDSLAAGEKTRLASAGFSVTVKREEVSISSRSLTAGVFSDKAAAEAAVKKLKENGLKASLKQQ